MKILTQKHQVIANSQNLCLRIESQILCMQVMSNSQSLENTDVKHMKNMISHKIQEIKATRKA